MSRTTPPRGPRIEQPVTPVVDQPVVPAGSSPPAVDPGLPPASAPVTGGDPGSSTRPAGNDSARGPLGTRVGGNEPVRANPERMVLGPYEVPPMWKIPAAVADLIGTPEAKLDLEVMKSTVGAADPFFKTQSDAFRSMLVLDVAALLQKAGAPTPNLIAATGGHIPIEVSNANYKLEDGVRGARALVYSNNWDELLKIVQADPDALFLKQMLHRSEGRKVGGPADVCEGHAFEFTATHKGWFDAALDENGKAVLVRGDYPTDYGAPPSGTAEYTFRMTAITKDAMEFNVQPPDGYFKEASAFVRTLSALGMSKVPFSSGDLEDWDQSYFINDLDIDRGSKVAPFVDVLGSKLSAQVTGRDGQPQSAKDWLADRSRYCAEGAHDRPAFLMHARPTAGLREMQKVFNEAVEKDQQQRGAQHPDNRVGWKALENAGYIGNYAGLVETNAAYLPFSIPGDNYKPLAEYQPKGMIKTQGPGDGLLQQPLSIAGLVEGALGTLLPRDQMAAAMAEKVTTSWGAANAEDKAKILGEAKAFVQGAVKKAQEAIAPLLAAKPELRAIIKIEQPTLNDIHQIADALGLVLASGIQNGVLSEAKIIGQIHEQCRYEYMDDAGKKAVDQLLQLYTAVVANPTASGKALHVILGKMNLDTENMEFTFNYPGGQTRKEGILTYLPPHHVSVANTGFAHSYGQAIVADCFPSGFAHA